MLFYFGLQLVAFKTLRRAKIETISFSVEVNKFTTAKRLVKSRDSFFYVASKDLVEDIWLNNFSIVFCS